MRFWDRLTLHAATIALLLHPGVSACRACAGSTNDSPGMMTQGLAVPVDRDGKRLTAIDQVLLDHTKPDYVDGDKRAWRLASLVGGSIEGGIVEVEDAEGMREVLARASDLGAGRELVVTVNRAGALRLSLTSGDDIFAPFHGRGGNRGRAGDPTRVREVRHIWLSSEG